MLVRGTVLRFTEDTRKLRDGGTWLVRTLRVLDEDADQTVDVDVPERYTGDVPTRGESVALAVEASASVFRNVASVEFRLVGVLNEQAPARVA
ncbi:MAG: hypothetical protein QM658_16830 [Gordonia sp. (in: high G+C Gram-positive bacteria)]